MRLGGTLLLPLASGVLFLRGKQFIPDFFGGRQEPLPILPSAILLFEDKCILSVPNTFRAGKIYV